jgi:hypothetical protein
MTKKKQLEANSETNNLEFPVALESPLESMNNTEPPESAEDCEDSSSGEEEGYNEEYDEECVEEGCCGEEEGYNEEYDEECVEEGCCGEEEGYNEEYDEDLLRELDRLSVEAGEISSADISDWISKYGFDEMQKAHEKAGLPLQKASPDLTLINPQKSDDFIEPEGFPQKTRK